MKRQYSASQVQAMVYTIRRLSLINSLLLTVLVAGVVVSVNVIERGLL